MDTHVTIVGVLHIAFSILGILIAIIIFMAIAGGGLLSGDLEAIAVTSTVATVIAGITIALSLPGLIGGFGLLKKYSWARILILILAVVDLFYVPFGTVLGIYTFWVLLHSETTQMFS